MHLKQEILVGQIKRKINKDVLKIPHTSYDFQRYLLGDE